MLSEFFHPIYYYLGPTKEACITPSPSRWTCLEVNLSLNVGDVTAAALNLGLYKIGQPNQSGNLPLSIKSPLNKS
jgi:hypothetical protein